MDGKLIFARKQKQLEFEFEGDKFFFEIQTITSGELDDIREKAVDLKYSITGGELPQKINWKRVKYETLLKSVVKAPFEICEENFRNMHPEIFDKLWKEVDEFNTFSVKKN